MSDDTFENLNKPRFQPKIVSEFSMGQYDFERYNEWLKWCEKWSADINSCDLPILNMIQNYFSGLNVLWKLLRPIVSSQSFKKEIDDAIIIIRKQKRIWEFSEANGHPISKKKILEVVDNLDSIHTKLMEIKQILGLGIVVKRSMNTKEKIRAGMRSKNTYGELPEP